MKKTILILIFIFSILIIFSNEIQQPIKKLKQLNTIKGKPPTRTRPVPEYEFLIEPADLITTFYDYMPGSYNGIPICIQPEISQPGGYEAGGVYIVFHAKETSESNRKTYCTYIDSGGYIGEVTLITENIWNGYPGIDIDPVTADPFVAWHQNDGSYYDVFLSYNIFHFIGETEIWRDPFVVIDNPTTIINPDDEFIWPIVQIGPSPIVGKRRVYVLGRNASPYPMWFSENALLAYADFDSSDLDNMSSLDWTYTTIPRMDEWANEEPAILPFYTFKVSDDGKVAVIGNLISWDEFYDDHIFILINDNYAEGDFEFYSEEYRFDIEPPSPEYPDELYFTFSNCKNFNAIFTDNDTKIKFTGSMGLFGEIEDETFYFPKFTYPKEFIFDVNTHEFSLFDLYPQDDNPEEIFIPFEGEEPVLGWPIYFYDDNTAFHENYFKIVKNEEKNWLAAVWSDGLKAKLANEQEPGYEDWLEIPEIAICISNNNGETWSEPIFLNSLETPELEGMIPCYIYPGDLIEDIGNEHGKLHLFFLDDYSYGSSIHGFGLQNGGMLKYAALDIDFGYDAAVDDNEICSSELVLTSFPNPFSSETRISFNVTQNSRFVTLEIYNIKGQCVREFEIRNDKLEMNEVMWNGKDNYGKLLSSGIYFIKLKSDKNEVSKKITLFR